MGCGASTSTANAVTQPEKTGPNIPNTLGNPRLSTGDLSNGSPRAASVRSFRSSLSHESRPMNVSYASMSAYLGTSEEARRNAFASANVSGGSSVTQQRGGSSSPGSQMRQRAVFGVSLDKLANRAPFGDVEAAPDVAWPVEVICRHLQKVALDEEGLFRIPGDKLEVDKLRLALCDGRDLTTESNDPHAFSQLLRHFFRELPTPLLTNEVIMNAGRMLTDNDTEDCAIIQSTLSSMSSVHFANLRRLIRLLYKITQRASVNLMNSSTLATCWMHILGRAPMGSDPVRVIAESIRMNIFFRRMIELQPSVFRDGGETRRNTEDVKSYAETPYVTKNVTGHMEDVGKIRPPGEESTIIPNTQV